MRLLKECEVECPYKGLGCAKEDDCTRVLDLLDSCNLRPYMDFLEAFSRGNHEV